MKDRIPVEVFPPGEFLRDILEERGWNQTEFSEILGRPQRVVNEILAGKRSITPDTAKELSAALNTSAQYWLNLEAAYQLSKTAAVPERIGQEARLRSRFPVREMVKRGWIRQSSDPIATENQLLGFFGIKSIDEPLFFSHAARRNYVKNLSSYQQAWLWRVRQLAVASQIPSYSESRLRELIPELEALMVEPEEARHVPRLLSECGVRFVIVEPIPGSEIDGVCFWINDGKSPVIGLSLKGDQLDKFWFNLWHEIEHVLRGDGKIEPVIDEDLTSDNLNDDAEKAANTAAANHCTPTKDIHGFIARHDPMYSEQHFIGFCRIMKRHPGIVMGQLQKRLNRWTLFKKYQAKVRSIITQTALTDGYGYSGLEDL